MAEQKAQPSHNLTVGGVFLFFLGVVFILQTVNVLPWGLWGTLWRFWPVLLIAFGLGILIRHLNFWLVHALIFVLFLAALGVAILQYEPFPVSAQKYPSYSESVDTLEKAKVEIDFTAGSLVIASLPSNSPKFVEAVSRGNDKVEDIRIDFSRQDSTGIFYLGTKETAPWLWNETSWEIRCTKNIPLIINIRSTVGNLDLDFSELKITELSMNVDAGHYAVIMPSSSGITLADISANIANIEITIPEGVDARLKVDADLASLEVNEKRFPRRDDYYQSENFATAANRIELDITCDIGRVQIR